MKKIKQHAKRLFRITPKFVHGMVVGAFVGIIVVTGLRAGSVDALNISAPRDCDTNAVITCGALTTAELQQRYSNTGVAAIYNHFGISAKDIAGVHTTAVSGLVYKDGTITADGKVVATGAITAGRENITGSTRVVSGGVTFYKRAPSVSFRPNTIAAFVVIENGTFKYAVLAPCGNPVSGTPVAKPISKPKPTPTETPTPVAPVVSITSTQTPPSTPVISPSAAPAPTPPLPNTGPGAVLIIGLLAVVGGYLFHISHRHVRRKRRARAA